MQIVKKGNRKAISPVLATVILIAITLIAAIAIAGFVFGLFGTFTATAQVSATAVSCAQTTKVCTLVLTNNGNSPVTAQSCSFSGSGGGAGTSFTGGVVPAGSTLTGVVCTFPGTATLGAQVAGGIGLSNGGQALFTGTWQ